MTRRMHTAIKSVTVSAAVDQSGLIQVVIATSSLYGRQVGLFLYRPLCAWVGLRLRLWRLWAIILVVVLILVFMWLMSLHLIGQRRQRRQRIGQSRLHLNVSNVFLQIACWKIVPPTGKILVKFDDWFISRNWPWPTYRFWHYGSLKPDPNTGCCHGKKSITDGGNLNRYKAV